MKTKDEIIACLQSNGTERYDAAVRKSIALYSLIRELYERNTNIRQNEVFMWAYAAYYGLSIHYERNHIPRYFEVLQACINHSEDLSLTDVVRKLRTARHYYVYASKLMNFADDNRYAIVDSRIAEVLSFRSNAYLAVYDNVIELYNDLYADKRFQSILKKYDFHHIGKMKQVDIILWNLNPENE